MVLELVVRLEEEEGLGEEVQVHLRVVLGLAEHLEVVVVQEAEALLLAVVAALVLKAEEACSLEEGASVLQMELIQPEVALVVPYSPLEALEALPDPEEAFQTLLSVSVFDYGRLHLHLQ